MLFRVEANKDMFVLNPELKGVSEFVILSPREMMFVALVSDYQSPFRKVKESERRRLSAMQAGWAMEKERDRLDMRGRDVVAGKNKAIETAILKYKEMQFDENLEDLEITRMQIDNIKDMVRKARESVMTDKEVDVGEMEKINKLLISLPTLRKTQRELAQLANIEPEVYGDSPLPEENNKRELSFIDQDAIENQSNGEV